MNQKHGKLFIKAKKKIYRHFREKTLFSNLKLKKISFKLCINMIYINLHIIIKL